MPWSLLGSMNILMSVHVTELQNSLLATISYVQGCCYTFVTTYSVWEEAKLHSLLRGKHLISHCHQEGLDSSSAIKYSIEDTSGGSLGYI